MIAVLGDDFPIPPEFIAAFRDEGHSGAALARACAARARACDRVWRRRWQPASRSAEPISTPRPAAARHAARARGQGLSRRRSASRCRRARSRATSREAKEIAARIGYPVVLKAQAAALAHKSDAGGVALEYRGCRRARRRVAARDRERRRHAAGPRARRHAGRGDGAARRRADRRRAARSRNGGRSCMVGLGGIWTEALDDVRLMPADLPHERHHGRDRPAQGRAPAATACAAPRRWTSRAVADVVMRVGALMRARPEISEIDINPLVAYPRGRAGARCADRRPDALEPPDCAACQPAAILLDWRDHDLEEIRDGSVLRPDQMPARQVLRGGERASPTPRSPPRSIRPRATSTCWCKFYVEDVDRHRPFRERKGAGDPRHPGHPHDHHLQGVLIAHDVPVGGPSAARARARSSPSWRSRQITNRPEPATIAAPT